MKFKFLLSVMLSFASLFIHAKTDNNMLVMNDHVTIGDYAFTGIAEVTTQSSWDLMTDTAVVIVPKKLNWEGKPLVLDGNPILKKGNKVRIELGYDDRLHKVFDGYATAIHANTPITIDCQDAMWLLKTGRFNKAYRSASMSQLLNDMLKPSGVKYEVVADYDLGMVRFSNVTPAKVLEDLRKTYLMKCFFRDSILYVGQAIVAKLQSEHTIKFNRHVVENNLEYVKKEDVKIKLRCVIMYPDNKKVEFEIGANDGEVRTFNQYNVSEQTMRTLAEAELERLRYDGYKGSLTVFGEPFVQHGDIVRLIDDEYPDHEGRFLVKSVGRKFSPQGYRQALEIEGKVS
jgi:hypothetical protein